MIPKSQEAEPRKAPRRLNQAARTKTDQVRLGNHCFAVHIRLCFGRGYLCDACVDIHLDSLEKEWRLVPFFGLV
jgi:hypothetical protein